MLTLLKVLLLRPSQKREREIPEKECPACPKTLSWVLLHCTDVCVPVKTYFSMHMTFG